MSTHKTVLLEAAVDALRIKPDGIYVDATFGRGGHARAMLMRLSSAGRLIALDRDPDAVAAAARVSDPRLTPVHSRFSRIVEVLDAKGVPAVDGILLDLGVSSPQLDEAARGFSFQSNGPLDMRMDPTSGPSVAEWIAQAPERQIGEVIKRYGEERFAKQIARAVVAARSKQRLERTRQLAEIVAKAVPTREPRQNPATRTFQALRIYINQELAELEMTLPRCIQCLNPGGRLVVISFHSLEDRLVKRYLRSEAQPAVAPRLPLREREMPRPRIKLVGKPVRPSQEEISMNPRARSAVMRVAERLAA